MADDQATEVPDTEPVQAPDTTPQVTEMVACQCRSTYHWRHGGGACPNPARWCQWCKDGGCVLARQADAARESRRSRSSRHGGRRRRRRRHSSSSSEDGLRGGGMIPNPSRPALPLPPTVPFPMLPFPQFPLPMPMVVADPYRRRDASDASSSSPSSSSSSSGGSSDDGRKLSLQLYRRPRK